MSKVTTKIVHTAPLPHYTTKKVIVFSDHQNLLYDKSASFRCDGRQFHSPGPAAANALSPKVPYVHVTTHVWLADKEESIIINKSEHITACTVRVTMQVIYEEDPNLTPPCKSPSTNSQNLQKR